MSRTSKAESRVLAEMQRQVQQGREDPELALALAERALARPRRRSQCKTNGLRPCPFIGCRYSLVADVNDLGGIVLTRPELAVTEVKESCALDVADRGEHTSDELAVLLNLTRQRVDQVLNRALNAMRRELTWTPDGDRDEEEADSE